ncbi:MAG: biotin/lipoate--protein ligase family protein [Pararhodobacter sp.]
MSDSAILLPPPFTLLRAEGEDILEEAAALAPQHGAGTLLVREAPGLLAMAVVLEPEAPLAEAQVAFLLGMAALGDALAAHCPPERPVRFVWPDELRYDRARLGGGRFAVTPGCGPQDVPDWMVFAAELIADRDHLADPGKHPDSLSLKEDAFDPAEDIIASFAAYLMLYFDRWKHDGIEAVTNRYLMRIDPPLLRGVRRIEGDRLVEITPSGNRRYPPLMEALGQNGWRGARGPKL